MAFPKPVSPSPITGSLVAAQISAPSSTISPYDMRPASGAPRRLALTQNPLWSGRQHPQPTQRGWTRTMNMKSKPPRSIKRAESASCAQGPCTCVSARVSAHVCRDSQLSVAALKAAASRRGLAATASSLRSAACARTLNQRCPCAPSHRAAAAARRAAEAHQVNARRSEKPSQLFHGRALKGGGASADGSMARRPTCSTPQRNRSRCARCVQHRAWTQRGGQRTAFR